jgi:hypothetical protein
VTTALRTEKNMADSKKGEKTILPATYGCEILLEKTTLEKAKNKSFPNDAYLIWYQIGDKNHLDLVRGSKSRIFDMYYDNYGPEVVKKIDFGYGTVSPRMWGYKAPDDKKRK